MKNSEKQIIRKELLDITIDSLLNWKSTLSLEEFITILKNKSKELSKKEYDIVLLKFYIKYSSYNFVEPSIKFIGTRIETDKELDIRLERSKKASETAKRVSKEKKNLKEYE